MGRVNWVSLRRSAANSGIGTELRTTFALAGPLAAANLAQMAMAVTNTVMVGRLGGMPLAAAGLGGMLYFTVGVILQAVLSAVAPLAAHAVGGGDRRAAGRVAGAGMALAVVLALPFAGTLTSVDRLLGALGYDAALAAEIGRYLRSLAWGAPAFLWVAVLRSLLAALSHTRSVMAVTLFCVGGNALLNWVLIFGRGGAPALGIVGSGYASAINQWLMLAGLALCIGLAPSLEGLRVLRSAYGPRLEDIASIWRLGLPIGGIRGIEVGVFLAAGILIGLLGTAALGAHQLVLNCAGITFMVPLAIGQAVAVRVAYELGGGRPVAAQRACVTALALGIAFMAATAVVLWAFPEAIIAAYIDTTDPANRDTVQIARSLIAIAAVFQVFDGVQTIAAGALRGYRDTFVPMVLAALSYWGAGFLGGWLLAFPLGHGAVGLWWGLALGLAVAAFLLTWRMQRLASPRIRRAQTAVAR